MYDRFVSYERAAAAEKQSSIETQKVFLVPEK
jgi:hypothetical protein